MKKIVIASDSFKGSVSSADVAQSAREGILRVFPECEVICLTVSDGGEGLYETLLQQLKGKQIICSAHNSQMETINAGYILSEDGKTAVIETAAANGLALIPKEKRNPMEATTFGTGELIKNAIRRGCRNILLGIGGSATNDAGTGMLQALGIRFRDENGTILGYGGKILTRIASIDESGVLPELKDCRFTIICDVNNPLFGPNGAAYVYAPQKGADHEQVRFLDKGLRNFSHIIEQEKGINISKVSGAGAAGGMGAACLAFFHAQLKSGIETVLEIIGFDKLIAGADLIITGEGKLDRQTIMGKTASGILAAARKHHIPVIALGGCVENTKELIDAGFLAAFSILPYPVTLEQAIQKDFTLCNIANTTEQIMRIIKNQAQ